MSIRDVVFTLVWIGLLPTSFLRPWIGVLAWSWIAFMAPHGLTWGFARTLPVALGIGGATLLGFLFTRDRQPLPRTFSTFLLVIFAIHITLTTFIFAFEPALAFGKWDWVSKSLLMTFITLMLFQDRARLRWLFLVIAGSLGFYGLKGGIWVLRTGGGERVFGPDQSFFGDNNTLGVALCMALPMLIYLSREESRRWLKLLLRTVFFFTIIAVVFTYSRGAFLGLAIVLAVLAWRSPWRLRFGVGILLLATVAAPLAPQRVWDRVDELFASTSEETRDRSVTGRLEAWQTGWNIALSNPLTGGGFRAYWQNWVWKQYHEGNYITNRDAHSLYFELLGEQGFLGFGLYMTLLGSVLLGLRRVRRRWRGHPEHGILSRYAEMLQLALAPFIVAGAFLGIAYWDLYFTIVAAAVSLGVLSRQAVAAEQPRPARGTSLVRAGTPRPPGHLSLPRRAALPTRLPHV